MAFVHGKNTEIELDGEDLTSFANTSTLGRTADAHDTTVYGNDEHRFSGGLRNGTASIGGIYDDGATGPADVIEPLIGTNVTLLRRPEGTGTGLPEQSVNVLVTNYEETSPVADMVTWVCTLQLSGPVSTLSQS